jgi:hypothetical protein
MFLFQSSVQATSSAQQNEQEMKAKLNSLSAIVFNQFNPSAKWKPSDIKKASGCIQDLRAYFTGVANDSKSDVLSNMAFLSLRLLSNMEESISKSDLFSITKNTAMLGMLVFSTLASESYSRISGISLNARKGLISTGDAEKQIQAEIYNKFNGGM